MGDISHSSKGINTALSPLFLVGCPRSGTTMLASFLKSTPWGGPFETHFITKYYKRLIHYGDLTQIENMKRLVSDILTERPVQQWKLHLDLDAFCKSLPEPTYPALCDALCRQSSTKKGFASWGDKTPYYILDLEVIANLFPQSRVIYIVRDGRDVALSLLEKSWGPGNLYACAEYWRACNERRPIHAMLEAQERLLTVRYEDLLDYPRQEMTKVLEFLGWPDVEPALAAAESKVRSGNYDKWRTKMAASEIELFERVAGDTLRKFHYETHVDTLGISLLPRLWYTFHDRLHLARHLFYTNVIDGFRIRFLGKEPFAE